MICVAKSELQYAEWVTSFRMSYNVKEYITYYRISYM